MNILIKSGAIIITASLNSSETAKAIYAALPIRARVETWGNEIYFSIPVKHELENGGTVDVAVGDIGYWPPESCFCIFFGRTPASTGDAPKPASEVTRVGRVTGDIGELWKIKEGDTIELRTTSVGGG